MFLNIIIRFTTEKDVPQVLRIENDNFAEPWTEETFNTMLRKEFLQNVEESHNFYVSENNSQIIGYIIWENEYFFNKDEGLLYYIGYVMNFAVFQEERSKIIIDFYDKIREEIM